jgi:hypothetical protein
MRSGIIDRHAAIVSCWLCGISLHANRMLPDGGDACDDVRWYCTDVLSCTHRWIVHQRDSADTAASAEPAGLT